MVATPTKQNLGSLYGFCTNAFYLMSMAMTVCPFITKSSMVYFIYCMYMCYVQCIFLRNKHTAQ